MRIQTIGVLGAGQMGRGIAQIAAAKGYRVILRDIKQEFCSNGVNLIRSGLEKRIAQGKGTQEELEGILAAISTTTEMKALNACDYVIEAVPEILSLKQDTFRELGEVCREDAVLCTNTSSMSITEIAKLCRHPERCCGMHFFFPVTAMKLVEIIRSDRTSESTVAAVREMAAGMGKVPVVCNTDTPGFIVNRCLFAFMLEAVRCYEEGVASVEDIDTAMKLGLNHPLGPFEMMDLSGIDTFPHVAETLQSLPVSTWETPESVKKLIADGKFGRKSGEGWYRYSR